MREFSINRRSFLRTGAAGAGVLAASSWLGPKLLADDKTTSSKKTGKKAKHLILLFMEGGPSQLETFDPRPGKKAGAPYKVIETKVPNFTPSEHLKNIAKQAEDLCLIKTMSSKEGNHSRAQYLLRTGYIPNPTLKHPSLGSIVANELGDPEFDLPNFVKLRGAPFPAGYLGTEHNPFVISRPGQKIENLEYARNVDKKRMDRRMKLVKAMEKDFAKTHGTEATDAHKAVYDKARRLMDSPLRKKFYLEDEPDRVRKTYGKGTFADSCIIARRLIEAGVPAVEITLGGWDTHDDGFNRVKNLCGQLDQPWAALVRDLKQRGLWDETIVLWMGEFGRTPRITPTEGRGHWPNNFCAVLGGGGVKGGQVIGEVDADGQGRDSKGKKLFDEEVSPMNLYATLAHLMGWNTKKEYHAGARPVWLVDKEAKPVEKVYS